MKKLIITLFALMLSTAAFSQWTFGYKLGMNISTLSNFPEMNGYDKVFKTGFAGGVTVEYRFSRLFGLESGLVYSRQGISQVNDAPSGTFTLGGADLGITKMRDKYRLNYLNLPLKMNFHFGKFTLTAGGQAGYAVNAQNMLKTKYDGNSVYNIKKGVDKNKVSIDREAIQDFDYGVLCGVSYDLWQMTTLSLEYYNGLKNTSKVMTTLNDKDQLNQVITASLVFKL